MRMIWLAGVLAACLALPWQANAQTLDCDTVAELGGRDDLITESRPTLPPEPCRKWEGSTPQLTIYLPVVEGWGPLDRQARDLQSFINRALTVYRDQRFIADAGQPPIKLWVLNSDGPENTFADAYAPAADVPCVIRLFRLQLPPGPKNKDLRRHIVRQKLAHEVFHCVQYAQLEAPYLPSNLWWQEGSAEWASSIVYPSDNIEYDSTEYYHPHELLYDQCDPGHGGAHCNESWGIYATALFFQDMASQKGNGAVFRLLQSMPRIPFSSGVTQQNDAQQQALAEFSQIDDIFERFVQDYMDKKVRDPGGGYMKQPDPVYGGIFNVDEARDIEVQSTPLMIYAYKVNLVGNKIYEISGLQDRGRFRFSYHFSDGQWHKPDSEGRVQTRSSCESPESLVIAITSAENVKESSNFTIKVNVTSDTGAACQVCACDRPLPACVRGHWAATEAPQLDFFANAIAGLSRQGESGMVFENGEARVDKFSSVLDVGKDAGFKASSEIEFSGEGNMGSETIAMSGGSSGTAQGQACLTRERKLCMQYQGTTLPSVMKISAHGMTIPLPVPPRVINSALTMAYTCNSSALTLVVPLEPPPDAPADSPRDITVRYHR